MITYDYFEQVFDLERLAFCLFFDQFCVLSKLYFKANWLSSTSLLILTFLLTAAINYSDMVGLVCIMIFLIDGFFAFFGSERNA